MTEIRPLAADDTIRQALDDRAQAQLDGADQSRWSRPTTARSDLPRGRPQDRPRRRSPGPTTSGSRTPSGSTCVATAAQSARPRRAPGRAARGLPLRRRGREARRAAGPVRSTPATSTAPTCCSTRCAPTTPASSRPRWDRTRAGWTTHAWRQGVLKCLFIGVPLASVTGLARARRRASWPRWSALQRRARGRRARRTPRRAVVLDACALSADPSTTRAAPAPARDCLMRIFDPHIHMTSRTTDDYERDVRRRRARARRAGLLARPAAHHRRLVHRLLRRPGRLGAVPGRPVRHRPPLHDRAQPQGGQRPALRRGARRAAALPRQGRRGRRRRDRLRLDDPPRRRRRSRASSSWPSSSSCPRWCTPRTATRSGAPAAPSTWSSESGLEPGHGRRRPPQRDHRRPGRRRRAAGWASPSTPTPRWTRTGWSRSCSERGLERVLVNSAADWGRSDPLLTRATGEAMLAAGFTDDDVDRVLWRNPVEFYGQSGRLLLDRSSRRRLRRRRRLLDLRGQLRSCAARRTPDAAAPPPTAPSSTSATAPTCLPAEDVDGLIAQLDHVRRPVRRHLGTPTALGLGLWLGPPPAAPRASAADPDAVARTAGRDSTRTASRWSPSTASPTPPSRTTVVK